jgi:hypothetical protein
MKQANLFDIYSNPSQRSYHDTTELPIKEVIQSEKIAKDQDERILGIFKENSPLGPSKCWKIYQDKFGSILLTSTRRSITNLTKQTLLTKTNIKVKGLYGRPEYLWKIT